MDEIVSQGPRGGVLAAHVRSLASDTLIAQRDVGTHRRYASLPPSLEILILGETETEEQRGEEGAEKRMDRSWDVKQTRGGGQGRVICSISL